jgi:hypothetical protein
LIDWGLLVGSSAVDGDALRFFLGGWGLCGEQLNRVRLMVPPKDASTHTDSCRKMSKARAETETV